jgi:nitrate reductase gamma subunit
MNTKTISIILLVLGLLLATISLFADSIGLGEGSGMGYRQIAGLVAGIILVIAGALLYRRRIV